MIKNVYIIFSCVMFLGLIPVLYFIYLDNEGTYGYNYIVGYVLFLFLYALYVSIVILIKLMKMDKKQIFKLIFRFVVYGMLFSLLNYIINLFLKSSKNEEYEYLWVGFSMAFLWVFVDLLVSQKSKS